MSALTVISHIQLTSDTTIVFNNIPQNYRYLMLIISERTARSATNDALLVRFNSGKSSTLRFYGNGNNSIVSKNGDDGGTLNPGNTATANTFSNTSMFMYNTALYWPAVSEGIMIQDASGGFQAFATQENVASPLTSLTLQGETTTNLKAGSSATLYGISGGSSGGVTVS